MRRSELTSLGRFQVLGELGRGGMGRVLEARDPKLGRAVAVKVVIDPSAISEEQLARFVAEAQITSQLQHPNIVPVYEMGSGRGGDYWFVMKKVEGRSLRDVLRGLRDGDRATRAAWSRARLLQAFVQVCNAVAYAHDRGVLHRDLKPDNVMLGPFGEVLLMDWGVARTMDDKAEEPREAPITRPDTVHTIAGATFGTPGYMSPEQTFGDLDALDGRSDLWSLGAILYELLTWQPAYIAENVLALLHQAVSGPPTPPHRRAPGMGVPTELSDVCLKAMAPAREDRFATALDLAAAVQSHLDGTRRRDAALLHLAAAEQAWQAYQELVGTRDELEARERALAESIDSWAPLEAKEELWAVRRSLRTLQPRRIRTFGEVLAACDQALSQDPESRGARSLLARVHYARFEEAEASGNEEERLYHEDRVRAFDDGRYAHRLKGTGSLSLRTDPPGAEVLCARYDTEADLVWPLVERRVLGTTPLEDLPLEQGSYLLTLRAPGKRDTHYPVFIPRGRRFDSGEQPVPLYSDDEIGAGWVYVPPGPFVVGGDPEAQNALPRSEPWVDGFLLSVFPVTMEEYCDFLNALAADDPEQAWTRVPRQSGLKMASGQYWDRPSAGEQYRVPETDRDGDPWDPQWPVSAVHWDDAMAYVAWRARRDGADLCLPSELQWEKAARGVDGRLFPWGDRFDPALCKNRSARPGRPNPEVIGAFPADVSPYGARDMAGGIRDWCGDPSFDEDPAWRVVRGGSWISIGDHCRSARRRRHVPTDISTNRGFRLARPVPGFALDGPSNEP